MIRCGILGGAEKDLFLLSELHRQEDVQIVFVFDPDRTAVAMDIAEILGIATYSSIEELSGAEKLDYVIVTEPRARYAAALEALEPAAAQILNPGDAFQKLCGGNPVRTARIRYRPA